MEWKSEYAIGIPRIDRQHRTIFEHLLALEKSKVQRDTRDIQRYFFAQLADSLHRHFEAEETLLEGIGYPRIDSHTASHARLAVQLRELEQKVMTAPTSADLVGFFEDWYVRHVIAEDRDYVAYLAAMTGKG